MCAVGGSVGVALREDGGVRPPEGSAGLLPPRGPVGGSDAVTADATEPQNAVTSAPRGAPSSSRRGGNPSSRGTGEGTLHLHTSPSASEIHFCFLSADFRSLSTHRRPPTPPAWGRRTTNRCRRFCPRYGAQRSPAAPAAPRVSPHCLGPQHQIPEFPDPGGTRRAPEHRCLVFFTFTLQYFSARRRGWRCPHPMGAGMQCSLSDVLPKQLPCVQGNIPAPIRGAEPTAPCPHYFGLHCASLGPSPAQCSAVVLLEIRKPPRKVPAGPSLGEGIQHPTRLLSISPPTPSASPPHCLKDPLVPHPWDP